MNNYKCYQTLGLHEGATMQEIKEAYRKLALKHHPDRNTSKHDGEKFKIITEAYQMLRIGHGDDLKCKQSVDSCYKKDLDSAQYWNEFNSKKILRELTRWAKYAEKAYDDICRYEQGAWNYSEKIMRAAAFEIFPPLVIQYHRVPPFLTTCIRNSFLRKKSEKIKSKLKL